jgi:hypothetical protein
MYQQAVEVLARQRTEERHRAASNWRAAAEARKAAEPRESLRQRTGWGLIRVGLKLTGPPTHRSSQPRAADL